MSSSTSTTRADQLHAGDRITVGRPSGPTLVRLTAVETAGRFTVLCYVGVGCDGVLRPRSDTLFAVTA